MMKFMKPLLVMLLCFFGATTAFGDDVTDSVNEALKYYEKGEYSEAAGSLEYAAQLIRQKKGGQIQEVLPEPLDGWNSEAASSQAAGSAMLGGGVSVERQYYKDNSSVTIQVVADSPLLQGFMMMFSNPMYATADGGKFEKIAGKKAIVKYDPGNRDGSINIVVDHRYLVTIEGNDITKADLTAYAQAVDYKLLEEMW
jgi:hypothetical protein